MSSSKLFLSLLAAFVVGIFLGGIVTKTMDGGYDTGYRDAWTKAEARAIEVGLIPETPSTVTSLSGTIEEVQKDAVVIATTLREINPFANPLPEKRTVRVTKETTIVEGVPLDIEAITKANEVFLKKLETLEPGDEPPLPPEPFQWKSLTLDGLRVGESVTVEAEEDIRTKTVFSAKSIRR